MKCTCPSGDCPEWERKAGLTPINPDCLVHGDAIEPMPGSLDPWRFIGFLESRFIGSRTITTADWNEAVITTTEAYERKEAA